MITGHCSDSAHDQRILLTDSRTLQGYRLGSGFDLEAGLFERLPHDRLIPVSPQSLHTP